MFAKKALLFFLIIGSWWQCSHAMAPKVPSLETLSSKQAAKLLFDDRRPFPAIKDYNGKTSKYQKSLITKEVRALAIEHGKAAAYALLNEGPITFYKNYEKGTLPTPPLYYKLNPTIARHFDKAFHEECGRIISEGIRRPQEVTDKIQDSLPRGLGIHGLL